ncbi:MAG TPA: hypothetical protein PKG90_01305 [Chitinophagaceae bacterium]|nr:hypothetical protein [Chitinophagaceae bacterium]
MKISYHKIGAVIYGIWGLIHVAGGAMLLADATSDTPTKALVSIGSAFPESEIPAVTHPASAGVLAFHSFNLLWMGLVVAIVAFTMNWKNSKPEFWLNTAIIGFADIGLIVFMLAPGIVKFEEGIIGPVLWPLGMFFLLLGLRKKKLAQNA